MSFTNTLKPATIERRRVEEQARQASRHEAFLINYATIREQYDLPEPPTTGAHFATDLADGRAVIVTADGVSVF